MKTKDTEDNMQIYSGIIRGKLVGVVIALGVKGRSREAAIEELRQAWVDWRTMVAAGGSVDDATARAELWRVVGGEWEALLVRDLSFPRDVDVKPVAPNSIAPVHVMAVTGLDAEAIRAAGGNPENYATVMAPATFVGGTPKEGIIEVTLVVKLPADHLRDATLRGLLALGNAVVGAPLVAVTVARSVLAPGVDIKK